MNLTILDIILLLPIVFGLVRGLMHGFVQELTSLVAIVAGVVCAKIWSAPLAGKLMVGIGLSAGWAKVFAYILLFVGVAVGLHFVGKLLSKTLSAIDLGGANRFVGALFGTLKFALLVSVCLNAFAFVDARIHLLKPETTQQSKLYHPLKSLAGVAWDKLKAID